MQELWADNDWILYRVMAAIAIGAAVGLEREIRDKPAGLRTMILISLGACVFSMISLTMAGPRVDSTRIAAQIVTGIGFLGAGTILRSTKTVYGLTTAACIWGVAAMGMACGFGLYSIAVIGAAGMLGVLVLFHQLSVRIDASRSTRKYRISTHDANIRFDDLQALFDAAHLKVLRRNCYRDGDQFVYTFRARGAQRNQATFREKLLHMENLRLRR